MKDSVPETSLTADILRYLRYQLRGRRGLVASGLGVGAAALWFGWSWLVAAGLAPILLAIAPCAIMCALGFCTMRACPGGTSGSEGSVAPPHVRDIAIASPPAPELVAAAAEQVPAAIPLQPRGSLAEDSGSARAEDAGSAGHPINGGKENAS